MKLTDLTAENRFFGSNFTYFGFQSNSLALLNEGVTWGYSGITPTLNSIVTVTIIRSAPTYVELRINGVAVASIAGGQSGDADAFLALMWGEYSRVVLTESALSGTQLTDLEAWVAA